MCLKSVYDNYICTYIFKNVPMAETNPMVVVSRRKCYNFQGKWNLGLQKCRRKMQFQKYASW